MSSSEKRVFISYAQADRDYAEDLMRVLEAKGIDVWIDKKIEAGSDWDAEIQNAMRKVSALVLILSSHSLESQYVNYEIGSAIAADIPVIPVLVGDVESLPIYLRRVLAVDTRGLDSATTGVMVADAFKKLQESENDG
jgi:hypothetical protein